MLIVKKASAYAHIVNLHANSMWLLSLKLVGAIPHISETTLHFASQ